MEVQTTLAQLNDYRQQALDVLQAGADWDAIEDVFMLEQALLEKLLERLLIMNQIVRLEAIISSRRKVEI